MYFLDFDRTLFDTPLLYKRGIESGAIPQEFVPLVETAIAGKADYSVPEWDGFFGGLEREEFEIIPADASALVYADAKEFLASHGNEVVVVTAGRVSVQKRKVERSGVLALVQNVIYSEYDPKGDVLARNYSHFTDAVIFVDDKESQLTSVKTHFPDCSVFQIVRSEITIPSVQYPILRSLTELP